ncbi:sensor histidine kinase [Kitasatospora sp. NPDC057015]|uniref:sensor histidine kinase n=1 Tax=Kitasatospora sp. NPDC057015 TaxID=3346001 RepID=UPI0036251E34
MSSPPLPLIRRVPPGVWTALAWCAGTAYSFLVLVRLPGESGAPHGFPVDLGLPLRSQWVFLIPAAALTAVGSRLLRRYALVAAVLLLAGSAAGAMALNSSEINLVQFLPVDVALCVIAAARPRRVSLAALVLAILTLVVFGVVRLLIGFRIGTSTELAVALTAVVAWFVGNSTRQSRRHAEQLGARAAAQAVSDERLRIARELHDMVAHSIGIVALQAGAAHRVFDTQPDRARAALRAVEAASRETLSGLRRMLGALRQAELDGQGAGGQDGRGQDGGGQGGAAAPLHPAPGLADVEQLAASTTAAGVRVEVSWLGDRRPLPAEVDLSAFRIIQESVTNVVRHARTGHCRVAVEQREDVLSIEVVDRGRGAGAGAGGYGLVGMRERVALLDGEFAAGPQPGGGFRVAVRLPVRAVVR